MLYSCYAPLTLRALYSLPSLLSLCDFSPPLPRCTTHIYLLSRRLFAMGGRLFSPSKSGVIYTGSGSKITCVYNSDGGSRDSPDVSAHESANL